MKAGARRFVFARAVEQNLLLFWRQLLEGFFQVDLVALRRELDELEQILRGGAGAKRSVEQGLRPVGNDFGWIEVVDTAEAVAFRACAVSAVEGEAARLDRKSVV